MDAAIVTVKGSQMTISQEGLGDLDFDTIPKTLSGEQIQDGVYDLYSLNFIKHGKLKNHYVITVAPRKTHG